MMTPQYSNLSKDEIYLISRAEYEKQKLITSQFAQKLFNSPIRAANVLDTLKKKGRLLQLERGKYIVVPIKAPNQKWTPNEFVVAALWMGETPYYIGYFTMYNYWGFTEQIPQTVFILNTQKSWRKVFSGTRYQAVKIDQKKYYGIQKIEVEGEQVCTSDKERTLVDFIYNPIGSSYEVMKQAVQDNLQKIDLKKFVQYLLKFPVAAVRKRAGYILEELGAKPELVKTIKKSVGDSTSYVVLDPFKKSRKGKVNMEWGIIDNRQR